MEYTLQFSIILLAVGLLLIALPLKKSEQNKKQFRKYQKKTISSFKNGDKGKLIGTVRQVGTSLIAPMSHESCVFYHVKAQEFYSSQGEFNTANKGYWVNIFEEKSSSHYLIEKDSAYAYVDERKMMTHLTQIKVYSTSVLGKIDPKLRRYLEQKGIDCINEYGGNKHVRCIVKMFKKDQKITVAGEGRWRKAQDLSLPERYGNVLEITASKDDVVYLSDHKEVR